MFPFLAGAAEIHVPADYATIQAAIDASTDGDVILIADGIWSGPGNIDLDPGGKAVSIQSGSGNPETCIISGSDMTRGFRCHTSETSSTVISGLTIRNTGSYDFIPIIGAGISCEGASPSITNCRFINCDAESSPNGPGVQPAGRGGGIDCDDGSSPVITGCFFENCRAGDSGGAIACSDASSPVITSCTFTDCEADDYGGAIYVFESEPVISHCTFSGNRSFDDGGAISVRNAPAQILSCEFENNRAFCDGGAICLLNSDSLVENNRFAGNRALKGGGMACFDSAPVIGGSAAAGNTFEDNFAGAGADLFAGLAPSPVTARFNTFSGLLESDYSVSPQAMFDLTGCQSSAVPVQADVYVSPDGDDSNDGLTKEAPFRTLHHAMSRILPDPEHPLVVNLAAGTYSAAAGQVFPVSLMSHLTIRGAGSTRTILDAGYTNTGLIGYHDENVCIENLCIRHGSGSEGGGIQVTGGSIELQGLDVVNCVADDGGGLSLIGTEARLRQSKIADNYTRYDGDTAGIRAVDSILTVSESVIERNSGDHSGGGLGLTGGECRLTDCVIDGNRVDRDWGGGIKSYLCLLEIVNCRISSNRASVGAGVYVTGSCNWTNCLIVGNTGSYDGAALWFREASGTIRHSTIAGTACTYPDYSATHFENSTLSITDTIFWNSQRPEEVTETGSATTLSYCDVRGGYAGTGNIDADPMFVPAALSDYYLDGGEVTGTVSPCIDAGSAAAADCVYSGDWGEINLASWTATAGWSADGGVVDMGFHWDHPLYTGVKLDLSQDQFESGDIFRLDAVMLNHSGSDWNDCRLFVILDVYGSYWFAPSWISGMSGFDCYFIDLATGSHDVLPVIPEFIWPSGTGQASGLMFYGAVTDPALTQILGNLDVVMFGYGD